MTLVSRPPRYAYEVVEADLRRKLPFAFARRGEQWDA